jgi:hypothetical protein
LIKITTDVIIWLWRKVIARRVARRWVRRFLGFMILEPTSLVHEAEAYFDRIATTSTVKQQLNWGYFGKRRLLL